MFKGNTVQVLKHSLLFVLLFCAVASLGLMGPNWMPFLSFALVMMLPGLLLIMPLLLRANRFTLDDQGAEIIKPGGRRIPYGRVKGFLVLERGGTIDVYAERGALNLSLMVRMMDKGERQRLLDGLQQRFPGATVRTKRRPNAVTLLAAPALLVLAFAAAHGFLYHRYPALASVPRLIEAGEAVPAKRAPRKTRDRVGDFRFTLPAGYEFIGEGDGTLSFEDRRNKSRLELIAKVRRNDLVRHAFWFRYGMGVRDYADLTAYVFRARYGVVPLFLRALAVTGQKDVVLYETAPPLLRGYVSQGKRVRDDETHIFLAGERSGQELHIYITGPERVAEGTLRSIVSSVHTAAPAAVPGKVSASAPAAGFAFQGSLQGG